ncbi:MAG TPA: T9SS type A sorting domain-containing protein [Ignavibacteria bacterium]|nr:hypothetical protein [Bacteroidota bacterium]HRI84416.1 T9SS type A sorting domain-containing protein [Ignavibacteria bacterium]HRJ98368.1 T9SS type A sorting domain-containing protein [Ignavibacteria bacterium]
MKNLFLFLVFFVSSNLFSQIILTSANNPVPGNTTKSITCDTTGITEGNSGANQTWNFNGLVRRDSSVHTWVASNATPYSAQFPNSNIASTPNDSDYSYYNSSTSELIYNGYGGVFQVNSYSNPETILQYPFTFNSNFSDSYSSVYNNGIGNSYLNGTVTTTGDAWGTLVLPNGSFSNALQVRNVTAHRDSSAIGGLVLDFSSTAFTWFVQGKKFPVLEVRYNTIVLNGNPVFSGKFVSYSPDNPTIGITQINTIIADEYTLGQNYPNPFNPATKIKFDIAAGDKNLNTVINLSVFDQLGKEVATLVNEYLSPGSYEVDWNASNISGGVYYYKLTAGNFTETKKMILVK